VNVSQKRQSEEIEAEELFNFDESNIDIGHKMMIFAFYKFLIDIKYPDNFGDMARVALSICRAKELSEEAMQSLPSQLFAQEVANDLTKMYEWCNRIMRSPITRDRFNELILFFYQSLVD